MAPTFFYTNHLLYLLSTNTDEMKKSHCRKLHFFEIFFRCVIKFLNKIKREDLWGRSLIGLNIYDSPNDEKLFQISTPYIRPMIFDGKVDEAIFRY